MSNELYGEVNKENLSERPDLKISGSGSASGGVYNKVKISGSGTINGDIECIDLKTSGSSKILGNAKAGYISTSGSCKIEGEAFCARFETSGSSSVRGDLKATKISTSGNSDIGGNVEAQNINISGTFHVGGSINTEEIKISGSTTIGEDCNAEIFDAKGSFKIGGLLNADNVKIHFGGNCSVREIGGEKIEVKKWGGWGILGIDKIIKSLFSYSSLLSCDVIEGDEIYIEATKAKIVRGKNVVIGPDCDIEIVEYSNGLSIDPQSRVQQQKKN